MSRCPSRASNRFNPPDWLESSWQRAVCSRYPGARIASDRRRARSRLGRCCPPHPGMATRVWGRSCCCNPGLPEPAGGCRSSGRLPANTGYEVGRWGSLLGWGASCGASWGPPGDTGQNCQVPRPELKDRRKRESRLQYSYPRLAKQYPIVYVRIYSIEVSPWKCSCLQKDTLQIFYIKKLKTFKSVKWCIFSGVIYFYIIA